MVVKAAKIACTILLCHQSQPLTHRPTSVLEGRSRGGGTKRRISEVAGINDRSLQRRDKGFGVGCVGKRVTIGQLALSYTMVIHILH